MAANVREKWIVKKDEDLVSVSGKSISSIGVALLCRGSFAELFPGRHNVLIKVLVGMAIISVAAGQCIGKTYRALIMTVYMYQLHLVTTEKTLLHQPKIRTK